MDKNKTNYPLDVPAPHHFTFAVRDLPTVTIEQRERALKATHYNEFAFPSGMLTVDMLVGDFRRPGADRAFLPHLP